MAIADAHWCMSSGLCMALFLYHRASDSDSLHGIHDIYECSRSWVNFILDAECTNTSSVRSSECRNTPTNPPDGQGQCLKRRIHRGQNETAADVKTHLADCCLKAKVENCGILLIAPIGDFIYGIAV